MSPESLNTAEELDALLEASLDAANDLKIAPGMDEHGDREKIAKLIKQARGHLTRLVPTLARSMDAPVEPPETDPPAGPELGADAPLVEPLADTI